MPEIIQIKKRSVRISGHNTSITIEDEFWDILKRIACKRSVSVNTLISEIDKETQGNLSSAVRIYVLKHVKECLAQ